LIAALVALAAVRCASVWSELPPMLMSHFDGRGRADGFMTRQAFVWTLAALGGSIVLMLLNIPRLIAVLPVSMLNIPHRDYWLPQRRPQVQHKLSIFTAWTAAGLTALLVAALELTLRANIEQEPLSSAMWLVVGGYLVGTGLSLVWLVRAFRIPAGARP
jgi:serine/threonine-protein kinase